MSQIYFEKEDLPETNEERNTLQPISWGAFHASRTTNQPERKANTAMLPLLGDKVQSIHQTCNDRD